MKRAYPTLVNLPDGKNVQRVHPLPAFFPRVDQPGFTQRVQVLHHAKAREVRERVHNLGGRKRPVAQQVEHRAPGGVRQRFPHRIKLVVRVGSRPGHGGYSASFLSSASMWFHPVLTPLRCSGSIMPSARCRSVTRLPPAVFSTLISTWFWAGYDMNIGPLSSSSVGGLMTWTKPHRCPMPLPRSRYQRPPGLASICRFRDSPSGLVFFFPNLSSTAGNTFSGGALISICCSTSSVRSSSFMTFVSSKIHYVSK